MNNSTRLKAMKYYNLMPKLKKLDPEIRPIRNQMDKTFRNMIDLTIDIDPNGKEFNKGFNIFTALERYKQIGTDLKTIDNELNNIPDVNDKYNETLTDKYCLDMMFECLIKLFEIHIGMFEREFKIKIELIKEF